MGYVTYYSGEGKVDIELDPEANLTLTLKFKVRGSSDPGCTYGPPERCYPPEGEEEREVIGVELKALVGHNEWVTVASAEGPFTAKVADAFYLAYSDQLDGAPFEEDARDPEYNEDFD